MPQAIVDPEEMKRFAAVLEREAELLRSQKGDLESRFRALGEVWRDQKHAQFEKTLVETLRRLDRFQAEAKEFSRFLREKARRAQRYLER